MFENVKWTLLVTFRMYQRRIYYLYFNFMHKNYCPTQFSSQVNVSRSLLFLILSSDNNK